MSLNCRIELAVEKVVSLVCASADWLIAVCQLELGDTLITVQEEFSFGFYHSLV